MMYSEETLSAAQAMFSLGGHFLYVYPTADELASYVENGLFEEVPFATQNPQVVEGLACLNVFLQDYQLKPRAEYLAEIQRDHFKLFEGVGEPKAPCWAAFYTATSSPILSAATLPIRQLYAKYGYEVTRKNQEPDDNLGIMLGFIAELIGKELTGEATQEDQRKLLVDHILPWLPVWLYSVEKYAGTDYCRGIALLIFGLCAEYARRFGAELVTEGDSLRFIERR